MSGQPVLVETQFWCPTHAINREPHQEHHLDLIDSDGAFTFPIVDTPARGCADSEGTVGLVWRVWL